MTGYALQETTRAVCALLSMGDWSGGSPDRLKPCSGRLTRRAGAFTLRTADAA